MQLDSFSVEIYIENIVEKGRNCSLGAISPLMHNILLSDVRFLPKRRIRFSLRDKRLFEIIEVEITRVDCISVLCGVQKESIRATRCEITLRG